jgi:hypothetical protein
VWGGFAYKTAGELTINGLAYNPKTHRIISRKKHISERKEKRLQKAGFYTKKGKFGYIKKTRKNKRFLGGNDNGAPYAVAPDGKIIGGAEEPTTVEKVEETVEPTVEKVEETVEPTVEKVEETVEKVEGGKRKKGKHSKSRKH